MQTKARLLIIEDEPAIRTGLIDVLVYHGFEVAWAEDGTTGYTRARSGQYDLILLDVMLPGMNGFEICAELRTQLPDLAIIMLTARDTDEDFIHGFSLGADDYVAKPFSITQLLLRIKAVLRRTSHHLDTLPILAIANDVSIDLANLNGTIGHKSVVFSKREAEVLAYLAQHHSRPVTREELLHKVWGYAPHLAIETRTVDIHIAKLRRKIEPDAKQPQYLITVRGAGYRLQHATLTPQGHA